MVGVAQLAEHMPVEHEVAGSFPVAHPKESPICGDSFLCVLVPPKVY